MKKDLTTASEDESEQESKVPEQARGEQVATTEIVVYAGTLSETERDQSASESPLTRSPSPRGRREQAVQSRQRANEVVPDMIARSGTAGQFAWDEFFNAQLPNKHTRAAYLHAVRQLLDWLKTREPKLASVKPGMRIAPGASAVRQERLTKRAAAGSSVTRAEADVTVPA